MKNYSDFQSDKIYNYKTYSKDGMKVLKEVNVKYLFSYCQAAYMKVEKFLLNSKGWSAYHKKNNLTFPDELKNKINDRRFRYILCETETITYDINGVEFSRDTKFTQHDKTSEPFNYQYGKLIDVSGKATEQTRTLYTSDKVDKDGKPRVVLTSGAIHYGERPTRCFIVFEGRPSEVEVKSLESLTIL